MNLTKEQRTQINKILKRRVSFVEINLILRIFSFFADEGYLQCTTVWDRSHPPSNGEIKKRKYLKRLCDENHLTYIQNSKHSNRYIPTRLGWKMFIDVWFVVHGDS